MLRKIESRFFYLSEAREYISQSKKGKELEDREVKLNNQRREERIKKKKDFELVKQEEKQRKNMERIRKQNEFKIFKGRKDRQRARKPELKPKEKTDDLPGEDIIDQLRYLG
jgi:hypothetical protein